jgi:hypothetical protein
MKELLYKSNPWWEAEMTAMTAMTTMIEREKYLKILGETLDNKDIVFLTGLRRVGKTSIMKGFIARLIQQKNINPQYICYISLDLIALDDTEISQIVDEYRQIWRLESKQKIYLFFDEVTHKNNYQRALKNLYDLDNVKIYASSSSASLLRDNNAFLTGRQRVLEIMPLDFNEYLQFRKIHIKQADFHLKLSYFEDYMQDGGMPEYVLTRDLSYLQNLIDSIIHKDIIAMHKIKNIQVVKDFYRLLMERSGKQLSLNKIAKILSIGVDTARRYLSYFEDNYLIYTIEKYGKLNERLKNPKKIYASDIGLKNIATGFRDKGAIFENLVFLHIKNKSPSYVSSAGIEIDFITKDKFLIEAKYNSVLNTKQQKLFDKTIANKKIVIDSAEIFLKFFYEDIN